MVAALLALAGCTSSGPSSEFTPTPDRPATQTTPDPHASIKADVLSLDPCALLDPQLLQTENLRITGYGQFRCDLGDVGEGRVSVSVDTLVPLSQEDRFSMARTEIGGAVAYRSSPYNNACEVFLPVNYEYAISFWYWDHVEPALPQPCNEVASLATAAAQKLLSEPTGLRRPAGSRDAIEACPILQEIVGTVPSDMVLQPHGGIGHGPQTCGMRPTSGQSFDPPVVALDLDLWPQQTDRPGEPRSVAGRTVFESSARGDDDCRAIWDVRPSTEHPDRMLVAELYVEDCSTIDARLVTAFAAVDAAVPAVSTGAQVLFASGESDSPVSGVCLDVYDPVERNCLPAKHARLPQDAQSLLAQGESRPNLLCTAAEDVVGEVFGRDFGAATVVDDGQRACLFVTADHSLTVAVSAQRPTAVDGFRDSVDLGTVAGYRVALVEDEGILPSVVIASTGAGLALRIVVRAGLAQITGGFGPPPIDTTPIDNLNDKGLDLVEAILS